MRPFEDDNQEPEITPIKREDNIIKSPIVTISKASTKHISKDDIESTLEEKISQQVDKCKKRSEYTLNFENCILYNSIFNNK